jgi:oligopeptide transport system substrate-binding protein
MLNETLGVVMQPEGVEFQSLLDRRHASDYEVARDGWIADYNEASTFLGLLASDSSQNDSHYANAQVDDWLKQAASSKDPTPFYKQVEEQVAKDVPIIPIYYYTKSILLKANLKGWPLKNGELIWYAKDLYKTAE